MSEENVETFKRAIDAYNHQDVEVFLATVDPEVECHPAILTGLGGEAAVYRGYEGMRQWLRDVYEVLGETHIEYPEIRDLGDRVLGIGRSAPAGG
jgi:SnoaL-like domain